MVGRLVVTKRIDGYKDVIIYTDKSRIGCSGENNDHPLVYYTVPEDGFVKCGYCDIKFMKDNHERKDE